MRTRLTRLFLNQSAWTTAITAFLLSIIYSIIMAIIALVNRQGVTTWWYVAVPFITFIVSYISYWILYLCYNIAASWTGGLEFNLKQRQD